ncbi:MAG: dTDP-4-dehydrorhamnose reductase [Alphaproteobacteria bacterium]|nr:dTDP-4-dehydrorhamnose reductase [Alphaproteobacteria bacterium]
MTRVLVTGAGGQLGQALRATAETAQVEVILLDRRALDITVPLTDWPALPDADLIINAAAYTDVARAEDEPDAALAVNAHGAEQLALHARTAGAPLLHISTDYVFDGRSDAPWRETDAPDPLNVYGRSKLAGEQAVQHIWERHVIVRTAWLYSDCGRNFLNTMLRLGADRDEIAVVADQRGTPTSAYDLAAALLRIADTVANNAGPFGVFHYTAQGEASWADFAEAIFAESAALLGRRPRVKRVTSADYPSPVQRPANSVLDCGKISAAFDVERPPWRDSLRAVIDRIVRSAETEAMAQSR